MSNSRSHYSPERPRAFPFLMDRMMMTMAPLSRVYANKQNEAYKTSATASCPLLTEIMPPWLLLSLVVNS